MGANVLVTPPSSSPELAGELLDSNAAPRRHRRGGRVLVWSLVVLVCVVAVGHELRTSALQAWLLPRYTARISYSVADGKSERIAYPRNAPFDDRLGYSRLGEFQTRLEERGFEVQRQAVASPELVRLLGLGIAPPYREPLVAGLTIHGMDGAPLYDATRAQRWFRSFDDVPPLLVQTLLYIENRELLVPFDPRANPAIEWDRMAKASLLYTGAKLGFALPVQGGSTLAIQLEKYRHSPGGRTNSPLDKLRQVAGASLKAYRDGADTRDWRREIVVDYFNTAPLAAAPGYGEIYGLGDALYAWFGLDLADVQAQLTAAGSTPEKARAYKHALALLIALRAPSYYLQKDRIGLEEKVDEYTRLLAKDGVVDAELAAAVQATHLTFLDRAPVAPPLPYARKKAPNAIRTTLLQWLDVPSFYELDRLHLEADGTIDVPLQAEVERLFNQLSDPKFVRARGLTGEKLLRNADPTAVVYSLMLFERTPGGNLLRVNADNLERPFDINGGVKLDLGSTAKLRTLAHYLEVVALLHKDLTALEPTARAARADDPRADPLSLWAAETLVKHPGMELDALLQAALDRKYSASPGETFFTGSGQHNFNNFNKDDNGRIMPVREALRNSTNLVFIRIMRDLVRYHRARLDYDAEALLKDPKHPKRQEMLREIADQEGRQVLLHAYRRYSGLTPDAAIGRLLGTRAKSPRHLAMLFYAWHLGETPAQLGQWLQSLGVSATPAELAKLSRAVGGQHLTLLDYGYLLGRQPLEVLAVGELVREPGISWEAVLERSEAARLTTGEWLFSSRARAAQNLRLRIRTEQDAFTRMTPYWQNLGFPFDRLVPSYATAIGSSSDRPAALAELMGIIVNDGKREPMLRLTRLHWGEGTPYETIMVPKASPGIQALSPAVASALRGALASVVDNGTARRLGGAFKTPDGQKIVVGGKTGSGDNRVKTFGRGGFLKSSRVVNRTATFAFYIGDRYFGVMTAFVPGKEAGGYEFTSALSVSVLKLLAPALNARMAGVPLPESAPAPAPLIESKAKPAPGAAG
ncbi:MAG: transglycosylase domain-containing protein [Candidatus Binatia bacterium]